MLYQSQSRVAVAYLAAHLIVVVYFKRLREHEDRKRHVDDPEDPAAECHHHHDAGDVRGRGQHLDRR